MNDIVAELFVSEIIFVYIDIYLSLEWECNSVHFLALGKLSYKIYNSPIIFVREIKGLSILKLYYNYITRYVY